MDENKTGVLFSSPLLSLVACLLGVIISRAEGAKACSSGIAVVCCFRKNEMLGINICFRWKGEIWKVIDLFISRRWLFCPDVKLN